LLEEGKSYLIITAFGWGFVGRFLRMTGLNDAVLADAHFVTNCGQDTDWGRFARNGPGRNAVVNKVGTATINLDHRVWSVEFTHDLPKPR
jgi:hypothetical protein